MMTSNNDTRMALSPRGRAVLLPLQEEVPHWVEGRYDKEVVSVNKEEITKNNKGMQLEKQYNFFKEHQEEFLRDHYGKVVLITDTLHVEFYDDYNRAIDEGWERYGMGKIMVHECTREACEPKDIGVVWN